MKGFELFLENSPEDLGAILSFWAATKQNPDDDLPFLVFADWLDETSDQVLRAVAERLRLFVQTEPGEMSIDAKNSLMDASNLLRRDIHRVFEPLDVRDEPSISVHPSGTAVHWLADAGWMAIYTEFPHVMISQNSVEGKIQDWLKDHPEMRATVFKIVLLEILSQEENAYLQQKGGSRVGRKTLYGLHHRVYLLLGTPVYINDARSIASMFEAAAANGGVDREGLKREAQFLGKILEQIGQQSPYTVEGRGYQLLMQVVQKYTS